MKKWTTEDSKELYNISGWGTSYFGVNERGNVFVTPCAMSRHPCFSDFPTSWTTG